MARILQLHFETHPARIAKRWGVSINCVRKAWRELPVDEMAPLGEAWVEYRNP